MFKEAVVARFKIVLQHFLEVKEKQLVPVAAKFWPLGYWVRGTESRSGHGFCLCVSVLCCPV
jgi:hypothetical protein